MGGGWKAPTLSSMRGVHLWGTALALLAPNVCEKCSEDQEEGVLGAWKEREWQQHAGQRRERWGRRRLVPCWKFARSLY